MKLFMRQLFMPIGRLMFSLTVPGQGDVLVMDNPSNEMDTWKSKCETI